MRERERLWTHHEKSFKHERTKLGFRVGEAITRHAVVAAGADVVIVVHVALMLDCCFRIEDLTTE